MRYDRFFSSRKTKKKNSKLDGVLKELAEIKSANAQLKEELGKANETILSLQTSLKIPRREPSDANSEEFILEMGPSSTRRHDHAEGEASQEMRRFMSSVTQISVSSINVPECKPKIDGEESVDMILKRGRI